MNNQKMRREKQAREKVIALAVLLLILNLPFVQAVSISHVRAESISEHNAVVAWDTDEPADSFANYGTAASSLLRIGDAAAVQTHHLSLASLTPETSYLYSVESNGVIDNNAGNLYSFTTLPPDTTPPELSVELPGIVKGDRLDLAGTTEVGAQVKLIVNGLQSGSATAIADEQGKGIFSFTQIPLSPPGLHVIAVEATDAAGNTARFEGNTFTDGQPPKITLAALPKFILERILTITGTLTENASIEFFVNNRSVGKAEGESFSKDLSLEEGLNRIRVLARDKAGWESAEEATVEADTVAPQVKFDLLGGTEYYEGRAETDVVGDTKPGATVYLYVFDIRKDTYAADLSKALAKTTADEKGKFTFSGVNFPPPPITSLEQLSPKQVPAGLEQLAVQGIGESAQLRRTYHIYIIAEDKGSKTAFAEKTVNVNSCSAGDFSFDIHPLAQFQTPFRLNPQLMEQGMQDISAVFNLTYLGRTSSFINPATNQMEAGYKVLMVDFQKACTQQMTESDDYWLGCKLLPSTGLKGQGNVDKTAFYVTQRLQRTDEFVKRDKNKNLWDEFKRRQLKLPLKILVQYQENEQTVGQGSGWSGTKTQVLCYDMAYSIDIPVESEELVPDFLAEDVVVALNDTIKAINDIEPVLQAVMNYAGIACFVSMGGGLVSTWYRIAMSNIEYWADIALKDDDAAKCPDTVTQYGLYLKSTKVSWDKLSAVYKKSPPEIPAITDDKILDNKCPLTATAWEIEGVVDKAYKWACDRFLCRTAPAGWTAYAEKAQVDQVEQAQLSCGATANCAPLVTREQCEKLLNRDVVNWRIVETQLSQTETVKLRDSSFSCYQDSKGVLYYLPNEQPDTNKGIWKLIPVGSIAKIGDIPSAPLFAYKPPNGESFCAGIDLSCDTYCKKKPGYQGATDGFPGTDKPQTAGKSCYKEVPKGSSTELQDQSNKKISGSKVPAGYTKDCFINFNSKESKEKYQCVCEPTAQKDVRLGIARQALPKIGEEAEPWDYQQDRAYKESQGLSGTYYPEWRYYSGRDFSSAFGLNYGLDNFISNSDLTAHSRTTVPANDYLGSFQTMCVTRINAHLQTLKATLLGLQQCIIDAKYNGLADAGACKTLFSQQVCGLLYKSLAYLASSCSPLSIKDIGDGFGGSFEDVAAFVSSGFKAVPAAIQTSIDRVQGDYGNAKLNQFFATGAQGFAESICMAAFGFDFPINMDFIQDVANSVSTKINVMFITANRELTTFDPIKGKSVHSYELAGVFWPGCKVRGYTTELKCIDIEDTGHPNVDTSCQGKGCDCLQATESRPELASERVYRVASGTKFGDIPKGGMIDLPIQSPERVTSNFRYDHVVFTIDLDQFEKPEECFDKAYIVGNKGVFYFPIRDITPREVLACSVHPASGRFICPQVSGLFGGGQTYFEYPYLQCLDKRSKEFVDCNTPNLFVASDGDEIVIKPYMNLGDGAACLSITDNLGRVSLPPIALPEGAPGPYSPQIPLGTVTENMISGTGEGTLVKVEAQSDPGCGGYNSGVQVLTRPAVATTGGGQVQFNFVNGNGGKYGVQIPAGVGVDASSTGYTISNNVLQLNGKSDLTPSEIDAAILTFNGFSFSKIFGSPTPTKSPPNAICTYQALTGTSLGRPVVGGIHIRAELRQPGPQESCFTASVLVPRSTFGQPTAETNIRVQAQRIEEQAVAGMHDDFTHGNYASAEAKAQAVVQQQQNNLEHAVALYYLIASKIMQAKEGEIPAYLSLFFTPEFKDGSRAYDSAVTNRPEYKKIEKYLCEVEKVYDGTGNDDKVNTVDKCIRQ